MFGETDAPGAGALHSGECRAGAQFDLLVEVEQEHDLVRARAVVALHPGDRAAVLAAGDMADPGQRAAHPVAAQHRPGAQQHRLDAGQRLHRVGQSGAAEGTAFHVVAEPRLQRRVAGLLQVQPADVVAPAQESGGATAAGDLAGGRDGEPEVGPAPVQVRTEGPGFGEAGHDVQWIVAAVDARGGLAQRAAGDVDDARQQRAGAGTGNQPGGGQGDTVHGEPPGAVAVSRPARC